MKVTRKFEVKYCNGKCTIGADVERRVLTGGNISAAMVRQILEQINPEMREIFGNYTWRLHGESGKYAIIATSGKQAFCESEGKTPQEAFWNCYQIRVILGGL